MNTSTTGLLLLSVLLRLLLQPVHIAIYSIVDIDRSNNRGEYLRECLPTFCVCVPLPPHQSTVRSKPPTDRTSDNSSSLPVIGRMHKIAAAASAILH